MSWHLAQQRVPVGLAVLVLLVAGLLMPAAVGEAGSISTMRDYLTRQIANLRSGEAHQIFFTPTTSLAGSGNKLVLSFPDPDDRTWCATAGSDLAVTGIINPNGSTENATPLPGGVLTASCTAGSGAGSTDTLIVDNVGPLTAGTKYGLAVADGTVAKLGTPAAANSILVIIKTNNGTSDVDENYFYLAIVGADQITVGATVVGTTTPAPNPSVEFKGVAAPTAIVTIRRSGNIVGTATASALAAFDVTLTNQPTGQQSYLISAVDANGQTLAPVTFALDLVAGTNTIITGIFLGPSIAIDKTSVKLGQYVTVSGTTAPNSSVTLTISSLHATSFTVPASDQGRWSKLINTQDLGVGTHTAHARAVNGGSQVSAESATVTFAVNPLEQCDGKKTADLNCDSKVNLTDFSILLYFWQRTNPSNSRADINGDGKVDVVDFSIMLYQWNG